MPLSEKPLSDSSSGVDFVFPVKHQSTFIQYQEIKTYVVSREGLCIRQEISDPHELLFVGMNEFRWRRGFRGFSICPLF